MKRTVLLLLILLLIPATLFASEITLKEDTEMHPQGWIAGSLNFKGGTTVIINDFGEVISGIMSVNYQEQLEPAGKAVITNISVVGGDIQRHHGKIGYRDSIAPVVFNSRGQVINGALGADTLVWLCDKHLPGLLAKGGTILTFTDDGAVRSMTLARDTYLRPLEWKVLNLPNAGFLKFKAQTVVVFTDRGEVKSGTLAESAKIDGRTYSPESKITFSENVK